MAQRIGVVLTGGEGRRMGGAKADLVIGDLSLAERAALALAPLCGTVLVSTAPAAANPVPRLAQVEDAPPGGRGPLAGIAAAYGTTGSADLLVLACDYPGVETPLLAAIVAAAGNPADIVFPVDGRGRDHPLVGLWRRSARNAVDAALASGVYKVRALLADLEVTRLRSGSLAGIDVDRALVNVNTPADLGAWRR